MHCQICNTILTDEESTLKDIHTGLYADTCTACLDADMSVDDDVYDELAPDDLDHYGAFTANFVAKNQHFNADGDKVLDSDDF